MKALYLESERLFFEALSLKHLSCDYVNWLNDAEVNKYLETKGGYTLEKLRDFLTEQEKKDILFWAIRLKSNHKHIGNIKIDPIDKSNNTGEYGILIGDKSTWGKGLAKEASQTIIQYCFDTLHLKGITLGVINNNRTALELYTKLGFQITDTKKNVGYYDNKLCDSIRMYLKNANVEQ